MQLSPSGCPSRLHSRIEHWLRCRQVTHIRERGASCYDAVVTSKATILVLDDDPSVRHLLEVLLRKGGYAVVVAADAASALAQCEVQLPDLMIVDLMLPVEDGEMFLREFRRRWRHVEAPVILLSASTARNEIARNLDVAAALGKPFLSEELLELVGTHAPVDEPAATG